MHDYQKPVMVTSVAMPSPEMPDLEAPIVVSADQNPAAIRIRDALVTEPQLGGVDITVHVMKGHAEISGTMTHSDQREIVTAIASRYIPLERVSNTMQMIGGTTDFCEA